MLIDLLESSKAIGLCPMGIIIEMYHFRLKQNRYTVCTNWWDSNFFWSGTPTFSSGTPTFCQMGVLNSCFQNPSENSEYFNEVSSHSNICHWFR